MSIDEFMELVLNNFPNARVGEDMDGQIIIYTGLTHDIANGGVIPIP